MRNNALRLLRLVNDLLDLNRLEEGKGNLESRPVDVNRLVRGLADSMRHLAESRGLSFQQTLTPTALVVNGDPHALEKIVLNLLGNAIKFTNTGGTVHLSTEFGGTSARIVVHDNGIGIGSQDLPYIFDRFRQADGSSTRRYQGTGLGLALAKELVEKQGGRIHAESRPGDGTTMTVQLPLAAGDEQEQRSPPAGDDDLLARFFRSADFYLGPEAEPATPPAVDNGIKATLLVVDDEPDMRAYLRDVLADEFTILQATDGEAGLALARRRLPDLVLLDLMMPKMDGLVVCRAIRGDPTLADTRVILLTARVDEQAKLAALDCGADDFLTKPFSRVEVSTRLRNLARSAALQRDVRQRNRELESAMADLNSARDQLIQSEKLNAIGMLTAGLLHEVNNPLNYAHTTLQILQEDPSIQGDDRLARSLKRIRHGMSRIRDIVANLRTFARPSVADKAARFCLAAALDTAHTLTAHERRVAMPLPGNTETQDRNLGYAVLFVDDEAMALEAFDMACGGYFPVLTASSAMEASKILENRSEDIAILISDQRMPQKNGVELLKDVRQRHPHITRMLTTAYADFDATVAALNEAEIFRYIPKPWDVATLRRELNAAMEHFLARRREQAPPRSLQDASLKVAGPIAHKLRGALVTISCGVTGLRRHLPSLLAAYDKAQTAGLDGLPVVRAQHRNALSGVLDRLEHQTRDVNQLMELILAQARAEGTAPATASGHSMAECVEQALIRFPFEQGQRALVRTNLRDDFLFSGTMPLMTRLIFNLLSNALHAISAARKGQIDIRLESRASGNRLYVRDGGTGIAPELLPRLFEEMVSTRAATGGHGLGLGFCRLVAETMGGAIECRSIGGEFAEFVVTLPPVAH